MHLRRIRPSAHIRSGVLRRVVSFPFCGPQMYETYRKFVHDHCTSAIRTHAEAVQWCEKAAELGCADAMEALAEVCILVFVCERQISFDRV